MRIIFMGTPEIAVPSLDILVKAGYDVVCVVTAPDRPAGRGRKMRSSPIKAYALTHNIPLLQPEKLRDPAFLESLTQFRPDLMVVVAFRMLPKSVWSIPTLGTFNLHSSLLPDYRGAAPINWVLINGETQTGVTTFMIDKQIDTGNILLKKPVDIPPSWTAGDLHDHLMEEGAKLVLKTVQGLEKGGLSPQPQDDSLFRHKAPKIYREDCRIDWNQPVGNVYNFIRGLSPYPTAWTELDGKVLKLFSVSKVEENTNMKPGKIRQEQETLIIACADGWVIVHELQLAGKKRMETADFLRGYKGELIEVE